RDLLGARVRLVVLERRQAPLIEHDDATIARHQLHGGVARAADRLGVRVREAGLEGRDAARDVPVAHDGSSALRRIRARVAPAAVPSSSAARALSPLRYARRPSAATSARLTFTPLDASAAPQSTFFSS